MSAQLCKNKPSYYLWMLIIIFCMFGFRLFPAIEPLTPVGMQVVGVFLGMVIGWSTVGLLWPSILGLVAVGFTGYVDTPACCYSRCFYKCQCSVCFVPVHFCRVIKTRWHYGLDGLPVCKIKSV